MAIYNAHNDSSITERVWGDGSENGEQRSGQQRDQNGSTSPTTIYNPWYTGRPRTPANSSKREPIDRQEIIRKIKSRESRPTSPELERPPSSHTKKRRSPPPPTSSIIRDERPQSPEKQEDNATIGIQIERPRSALHKGDFREKEHADQGFGRFGELTGEDSTPSLSTSPVAPWHPDFPAAVFRQVREERRRAPSPPRPGLPIPWSQRSRAVSNASLATSFVYKPPTSPLVQSSRPDTPEPGARRTSQSPDKSRRHTFSPQQLQRFQSALDYPTVAREYGSRPAPSSRQERTFPYQAHQPRRSLNSFQSLPQTPLQRPRRPSSTDSPLHHAPMVGSYEESILRGRMSTTPSKPLNFVAQIGVLGKGNCKPNLRCPPHVTIPFPAVFYSNPSASKTTDQPSPYVGLIDVENNLANQEGSPEKQNRRHKLHSTLSPEGSRSSSLTRGGEEGSTSDAQALRRRRHQKQKRRSNSPRAPPGGSYRIPQQGQLQIIIKNPNKTAVKLFLVPYDLTDMEPGQKTFIRQRSYSAGPIIDMPLSSRKNLGTDRPEASLGSSEDPNDRPVLRYLVHLHICCPSRGRYYLYKSIRVVFANRVPDGKERLRCEVQMPEPRFGVYKAGREFAEKDGAKRRSVVGPSTPPLAPADSEWELRQRRLLAQSLPAATGYGGDGSRPMQALPFHDCRRHQVNQLSPLESRPSSRQMSDGIDVDSDHSTQLSPASQAFSAGPLSPGSQVGDGDEAVLRDPFKFEREPSRERSSGLGGGRSESLLSRRLRDLAVQAQKRKAAGAAAEAQVDGV
jgi:hypothetical protein